MTYSHAVHIKCLFIQQISPHTYMSACAHVVFLTSASILDFFYIPCVNIYFIKLKHHTVHILLTLSYSILVSHCPFFNTRDKNLNLKHYLKMCLKTIIDYIHKRQYSLYTMLLTVVLIKQNLVIFHPYKLAK